MNLRFIEAFWWVVQLDSMTLAARRLSLTQSAVSSRIAALEDELGARLFERNDRRLILTASGRRLLVHAERLLDAQRALRADLGLDGTGAPQLRIGANESVLHTWLMPFVDTLRASLPDTKLELSIETTPALAEHLRHGTLDLCFLTTEVRADGVRNRLLPPLELIFVRSAAAGERGPRRTRLARLCESPLWTYQRGSQPNQALLDLLRDADITPARLNFTSSVSAMLHLVHQGRGVATLPRELVRDALARGSLVELRCEHALAPLPVVAAWRPDPASDAIDRAVSLADAQARVFTGTRGRHPRKNRSA